MPLAIQIIMFTSLNINWIFMQIFSIRIVYSRTFNRQWRLRYTRKYAMPYTRHLQKCRSRGGHVSKKIMYFIIFANVTIEIGSDQ